MKQIGSKKLKISFCIIIVFFLLIAFKGIRPFLWVDCLPPKKTISKVKIVDLVSALGTFRLDVGRYPTTEEGLKALIVPLVRVKNWDGPYLPKKRIPPDPWGREFIYICPGTHGEYDLFSYGADGKPGGKKENADIVSWEEE
ncbi:MAG: type II secretion system major pseudopilin GspG [bacterium]